MTTNLLEIPLRTLTKTGVSEFWLRVGVPSMPNQNMRVRQEVDDPLVALTKFTEKGDIIAYQILLQSEIVPKVGAYWIYLLDPATWGPFDTLQSKFRDQNLVVASDGTGCAIITARISSLVRIKDRHGQ